MKKVLPIILPLIVCSFIISCSGSQQSSTSQKPESHSNDKANSEYYTAAFPRSDVSNLLKNAQQSVVRIVASGFYDNYNFDGKVITLADIKTNTPKGIATNISTAEESSGGTAIILDKNNNRSLLITCEHTVSFPDTIITYYEGDDIPEETFIESISIKKNETSLVYSSFELKPFEVLATNRRSDLALLSVELEQSGNLDLYPLSIKAGNSDFLQLGSFLYILGFPKSYAMVTRGLASSSESWNDRFFITDATFNPGISGGLILATNDNYNSFQWVGMASSSTASRENVLVPRPGGDNYSRVTKPYSDSIFVEQKTRINYGITQAIPINQVKDFLEEQEELLREKGFKRARNFIAQN